MDTIEFLRDLKKQQDREFMDNVITRALRKLITEERNSLYSGTGSSKRNKIEQILMEEFKLYKEQVNDTVES